MKTVNVQEAGWAPATSSRQEREILDLPIRVAPDWDELLVQADRMAEVIDRHLDFESRLQFRPLRPVTLCPEQKRCLISDLSVL